jgi:hypothetical protein
MFFLFSRVCVERFFSSRVAAATNRKQHCRDVIWPYFVIDHREYCIHHAFKSSTIVPPSSTTSHRNLFSFYSPHRRRRRRRRRHCSNLYLSIAAIGIVDTGYGLTHYK